MVSLDKDKQVAKRLLAGDKKALRVFYRKNYPKLLSYVRARVRTEKDAEEIVQDTFLGFLDSLPLFSFRSSLWTFVISIARHEIADYFRKLYAKRAIKYVPFVDQVYHEPLLSGDETRRWFEETLRRLKDEEKKILLWKYEEGWSVREIADNLGVSLKAAESRLFRARKAFQLAYVEVSKQ